MRALVAANATKNTSTIKNGAIYWRKIDIILKAINNCEAGFRFVSYNFQLTIFLIFRPDRPDCDRPIQVWA